MVGSVLDSLVRKEDERIISRAVLGQNLHDLFSNSRIEMAIHRQSVDYLVRTQDASPEDGDLLTGAIGGSEPRRCQDGLHPIDESHDKEEADETALGPADTRLFRGVAARLNYMGHDRPGLQYAIKEAARRMASPRGCDWALLRKIGKYLLYRPRVVMKYPWKQHPKCIDGYTDSD